MRRRTFVATTTLLSAGCAEIVPERDPAPPPDSDEWTLRGGVEGSIGDGSATNLVLDGHDFATANGHVRVRGTIRNTRDEPYPGVEAEVTLFSEDGGTVDSGSRESEDRLEPDGTWRFAVVIENVDVEAVARYAIETGGESPL